MEQQVKERKKHLVEGEVSEIKKQQEGLGLGSQNREEGFLSGLFKLFSNKKNQSKGK